MIDPQLLLQLRNSGGQNHVVILRRQAQEHQSTDHVPGITLPETNMETPKGSQKEYSPSKGGLYGFPC